MAVMVQVEAFRKFWRQLLKVWTSALRVNALQCSGTR